jgi:hypothetical protein
LQALTGIFGAVAAPLGNIDKPVMIDRGAGSGDNNGGADAAGGKAAEPARVNGRAAPVVSAVGKETTNGSASSQ